MEKTTLNISEINNIISKAKETFAYEVWIPSLQRNVMFREITTGQQKRLLKAIIDSPVYNTEFIFALNGIIKENCAESDVNIDELTIYDKLFIALTMRIYSIGKDLTFVIKTQKTGTEYKKVVNLLEIVEQLKGLNLDTTNQTFLDSKNVFTITCGIPLISDEYNLEKEIRVNVENEEMGSVIQNIFINELVKYCKTLKIVNDNKEIELNFSNLTFKDRIKMLEALPTTLTKNIIEYISKFNKELNKVLILNFDIEGEKIEQRIKLDANFFTVS